MSHAVRRSLLLLLLLSPLMPAYRSQAQSMGGIKKMDAKYGFRDVVFETDSTALSGRTHVFDAGVKRFYARPTDKLSIGTGQVESIYYGFVGSQLAEVVVTVAGSGNVSALVAALKEEYGSYQVGVDGHDGQWNSFKMLINYDLYRIEDKARFRFTSKKMRKLERGATKKAGQQAASDL